MSDERIKQLMWLGIMVVNTGIWWSILTNGIFTTIMCIIIVTAIVGIIIKLREIR
tara:strand:- start:193 stop:357 length:165 start_codon:yes stop_codon:yes gene_type:complete